MLQGQALVIQITEVALGHEVKIVADIHMSPGGEDARPPCYYTNLHNIQAAALTAHRVGEPLQVSSVIYKSTRSRSGCI